MIAKLGLYANTIKSMKASQIYYRVRKMLKRDCSIGCKVSHDLSNVKAIATVPELDYDPIFLERFSISEFMQDKVSFLHSSKEFHWDEKWEFEDKSALWNFNLHYFEYLFPLVKSYKDTNDKKYLKKTQFMIENWIEQNPQSQGGTGWSPYTIDLRLTNWLSYYTVVRFELEEEFCKKFIESIHEQYEYLSRHLEKDILGNHFFEDLKTLVLCALFFNDEEMLKCVLPVFRTECKEEILPDGMHFELSPMYHKLVLEGIIRISVALREAGKKDRGIESYLHPMMNVAWSLEEGLDRIPLFNDCGNNVAKSLTALVEACKNNFGLIPEYKSQFKESGFYIFKQGDWKLIVDAGQPGPTYIPGHAHCDAMSFELFKDGKPVLVNCGTYAYQCEERGFFRSTAAHNTVMINNTEQSQCWGAFRMAKRSRTRVLSVDDKSIIMEMVDQKGNRVNRHIKLDDKLFVEDYAEGCQLTVFIHSTRDMAMIHNAEENNTMQFYAIDYGEKKQVAVNELTATNRISVKFMMEK